MLEDIHIANFKSWRRACVQFGRITGLFGPNASGKSNLIQSLLLLKQTRESTFHSAILDLNGPFAEMGIPSDVVHAHDENGDLAFGLGFKHPEPIIIKHPDALDKTIADSKESGVFAKIDLVQGALRFQSLCHSVGDASFALAPHPCIPARLDMNARVPNSDFSFVSDTPSEAFGNCDPKMLEPTKVYRFPDPVKRYFRNAGFLTDLEAATEQALDCIYYLGSFREAPQRDYLWAGSRPADLGIKGERVMNAIIAAEVDGEKQNFQGKQTAFSEIIAHWLRVLGLAADFQVEEIAPRSSLWQARVKTHANLSPVMLADAGFGVSQVLPVITLLHYAPKGSTVLLEQPEASLHPLAQAGLADVIVHAALHRNVQIVVESHSEHFLLRLQRRIAESVIPADDVTLYACNMRHDSSHIEPLELDVLGQIQNWPNKFMGDAFGETASAESARLKCA